MTVRSVTLTSRGRVVLVASAVMAAAAWMFGVQELYSLALAMVVVTVATLVWVATRRWQIDVTRVVHPGRVAAGQEARVELSIRNASTRSSPPVEARDPFDGGRRRARFDVAPLGPGETRGGSYRLPSARRGLYRLGPLEVRLTDPLGLASRTKTTASVTSLTVHPAYELLPMATRSSRPEDDLRVSRPTSGSGGSEFHTLREYVAGDDLRHVHWPTTARLDDLVIRQPEHFRQGRTTVIADLRASVHDDDSLERVLSAVASLALSALAAGRQARVVTTGGYDSGMGRGRRHGPAILDALAAAAAHRPATAPLLAKLGRTGPAIFVTTDDCPEPDLQRALVSTGAAESTVVVFERRRPGAERLAAPGRLTVRVGSEQPFGRAWSRRLAGSSLS